MSNALSIIGNVISSWWTYMMQTNIPGTEFSFGALYIFLFVFSIFLFIIRIVTSGNTQGGANDTRNIMRKR